MNTIEFKTKLGTKKYKLIIIVLSLIIILLVLFSFFINIGLNNSYFIKRDFNKAFNYRMTGDCEAYSEYNFNKQEAFSSCEEDKTLEYKKNKAPIRNLVNFKIQNISNKINSNKAFLQVEYIKLAVLEEKPINFPFSKNFIMEKEGLKWKIK